MDTVRLVEGLRYEVVGDELLILHVERNTVLRLTGPSRDLVDRLLAGASGEPWSEVCDALAEAGVLEPREDAKSS